MHRLRRAVAPLMVAMIVALASGCTFGPPEAGIQSGSAETAAPRVPTSDKMFVGTLAEYATAIADCMTAVGWEARAGDPDGPEGAGVIEYGVVSPSQQEIWQEDNDACLEELGTYSDLPANEAELREDYDWRVGMSNCLVRAGFPMPEPQSFATFTDEFHNSGTIMWDPIGDVPHEQYGAALDACPRSTIEWQ